MHLILFDDETRDHLLPFTYLKPVCELRLGVLRIREKWAHWFPEAEVAFITQDYLAETYPIDYSDSNILINGSALPSPQLCTLIRQMESNEALLQDGELIAAKLDGEQIRRLIEDEDFDELKGFDLEGTDYLKINRLWDLFAHNARAIQDDVELLTKGRSSQVLSHTNQVIARENVFVEPGARVECSTLNAENGPIYIGREAHVMEGALLRGPLALCERSTVKMGAKIYGGTTIGPVCKVGGEVSSTVFQGYANKAHDGYLGDSVIGEWCNLGADTNCSNLKNNYDEVKLWSYVDKGFRKTGQQFCGLFMGDHSKCGINTMFNTGTVVGISANVFGDGFPRNFIPSFSWGGPGGFQTYRTDKAFQTMERVMARRGKELDIPDRLVLLRVFEDTAQYRSWEPND